GFTFVTTTDFFTGSSACIDRVARTATLNVASLGTDPVARHFNGKVYVVNRSVASNIQILNPAAGFATIDQWSTGNGSGPHDIYVRPDGVTAYITRYDMTTLLKMNLTTGATLATINLSAFADADGIPEMDQMFWQNDMLFVTVQRLDRNNFYAPTGTSYLVKIDMTTDTVVDMDPGTLGVQAVPLVRTNPYSEIVDKLSGGKVWFSAVGFFGVNDGGIIETGAADPHTQTVILTEAAAGGDILDVARFTLDKSFAIVANASFQTELIAFNPQTGAKIGPTIYNPGGYDLSDIEVGLDLLVADRKATNPGIRFFDPSTHAQQTVNPVSTGLPPFDVLEQVELPVGVGDTPPAAALGRNYPNPFNPDTSIPFSLARAGRATLTIYDVNGRFVAMLLDEHRGAGEHVARWDGRDAAGRASSSGVYFARLQANGIVATHKLVLLK
ncbi:MAG TPA: T9SS type A sorting domain-containing protein, partial [Candidatus Krumholzibacteria bacterium]|nr:T9SS type A sorting domain-containing protein [Candidatus Krumholzibacteria bacterium]